MMPGYELFLSDIQYVPPKLRIAQHKSAYVPAPEADTYDRNKSGP